MSSRVFTKLDKHVWTLTYKWAKHTHPNKSRHWVVNRYFGEFNRSRRDRWVLGDRDSGAYLQKHTWTKIVRHQMVPGTASPDDPTLAEYWARRRQRSTPPLDRVSLRLIKAQHGRCPACGGLLLPPTTSLKLSVTGSNGSRRPAKRSASKRSPPNGLLARRTILSLSVSYTPAAARYLPGALQPFCKPMTPLGLLEPGAMKVARRVLRGPRRSNAPGLPDPAALFFGDGVRVFLWEQGVPLTEFGPGPTGDWHHLRARPADGRTGGTALCLPGEQHHS